MRAGKVSTEIRKDQIARAALDLIAEHGLGGLSVAGLARRVGLVPSAIYRHFGSKDEVLEAVVDLIRQTLLGNVRTTCQETADPLERLHRLLMRHVKLIREENKGIPRVIFSEDFYSGRSARKSNIYGLIRDYLTGVAGIIRQGQADGRIRTDLDPATGSVMFLGLIQPAAVLWHLSDGKFDVTLHAEKAWNVFRLAILAGKPQSGSAEQSGRAEGIGASK